MNDHSSLYLPVIRTFKLLQSSFVLQEPHETDSKALRQYLYLQNGEHRNLVFRTKASQHFHAKRFFHL